jgi:hypothetical protein
LSLTPRFNEVEKTHPEIALPSTVSTVSISRQSETAEQDDLAAEACLRQAGLPEGRQAVDSVFAKKIGRDQ